MAIKIDKKITKYVVVKEDENKVEAAPEEPQSPPSNVIHMHEKLERPDMLLGSTYKIKTPLSEHALYVTINDIVLNAGTEYELRRPFEIFINSKNMDHFQWIVALTRIISAVFRKGGDVTFLVEELKAVFDPRGGYFKKGGKFMPSLVAEIGDAIECHLRMIGLLKDDGLDEHQKKLIAEKRAQYEAQGSASAAGGRTPKAAEMSVKHDRRDAGGTTTRMWEVDGVGNEPSRAMQGAIAEAESTNPGDFPDGAQLCKKCNTKAAIVMDGCLTCLNCGDSKCG